MLWPISDFFNAQLPRKKNAISVNRQHMISEFIPVSSGSNNGPIKCNLLELQKVQFRRDKAI